jgi:outer membrane protein assembly factor BamC
MSGTRARGNTSPTAGFGAAAARVLTPRGWQRWSLTAVVLALSACSTVDQVVGDGKVDYRSQSGRTAGLEVPPDLSQLSRSGADRQTTGVVTASSLGAPAASTGPTQVAVTAVGDFRVERQGQQRWLVSTRSAEQLWEPIKNFWTERGFTIEVDNPQTGVIETGWAENRAKIPDDVIRRTLGRLVDNLYSTGERDRFRTRLERTEAGTEIFITHRGMEEVFTSAAQERTAWQPRATDPQLEAEFLSRLMIQLGGLQPPAARDAVVSAPQRVSEIRPSTLSGTSVIELDEGFDRAWRRVAVALDRSGFTVEDRDRSSGLFFVRYVDQKAVDSAQSNPLKRIFGGSQPQDVVERYRLRVVTVGTSSRITLQNSQGVELTGPAANRILSLLATEFR